VSETLAERKRGKEEGATEGEGRDEAFHFGVVVALEQSGREGGREGEIEGGRCEAGGEPWTLLRTRQRTACHPPNKLPFLLPSPPPSLPPSLPHRSVARGPLHGIFQSAEAREEEAVTERHQGVGQAGGGGSFARKLVEDHGPEGGREGGREGEREL
jgi:hypothetical protein